MAAYVRQLQGQASRASSLAAHHGGAWYRQLLERNKQYIAPDPSPDKVQELSRQLLFTTLASGDCADLGNGETRGTGRLCW
eukprot:SM000202S05889  [mRNA]  locus=s202:236865:242057:+ [translate_table: standard]